MPHSYNQRVFAQMDLTSPLMLIYLRLVAIELALKNHQSTNWTRQHDFVLMIASIGDAALTALASQVKTALESLWCEKRGGGSIRVSASIYPAIRYVRHRSDHSSDSSTDNDLLIASNAVSLLTTELRRQRIM